MESLRHRRLKTLSLAFLRAAGCAAACTEVKCPMSRYRVDVAGYADPLPRGSRSRVSGAYSLRLADRAATVVVECKQERADFLRDNRRLDALVSERAQRDRERRDLEDGLLVACEPHLRRNEGMLFRELESWDFGGSRSPEYRRLLRELRRLDRQIHGDTKFWMLARYGLADVLLIAAPAGLLRPGELPPGWGLLEVPPEWLLAPDEDGLYREALSVRVRLSDQAVNTAQERHRQRWLRNMAVTATSRTTASLPVPRIASWPLW